MDRPKQADDDGVMNMTATTMDDDHEAMPMLKDLEPGKLDDSHVVALMIDPVDDNHADLAMCISHHDHLWWQRWGGQAMAMMARWTWNPVDLAGRRTR